MYHMKTETNVGTPWCSAYLLGAAGVFTIRRRYRKQSSDTYKAIHDIPLRHFLDFESFLAQRALGAMLVGVEPGDQPLENSTTLCM